RVGVGVRPLASIRIGLAVRSLADLPLTLLLLELLRQPLRALAHGVERAALAADGVVGVALAELPLGVAHGLAGVAELVHAVALLALLALLPLLPALALLALLLFALLLAEASLLELLEQLAHAVLERLLVLLQIAHVRFLAAELPVAAGILPFLVSAIAQLLLLADHVAELVERLIHLVVALIGLCAGARHLQVFEHGLELVEQLLRGFAVAGAREVLQPIEHAVQIALRQRARIAIERPRQLLRVLAHLVRQCLHEFVHGGAQILHQLLDFLVGRA